MGRKIEVDDTEPTLRVICRNCRTKFWILQKDFTRVGEHTCHRDFCRGIVEPEAEGPRL